MVEADVLLQPVVPPCRERAHLLYPARSRFIARWPFK